MEEKLKKFFSEIFVNTYDYPFIIGFLEANGIEGVVPSLKKKDNRTCVNYEMFKQWWKQNCTQKQQKDAAVGVNEENCGIRTEANPDTAKLRYVIEIGDKSAVINIAEALDEFLKYNTEQAERFIFGTPNFKDLGYFIRKRIVSDIFD